MQRAAIFLIVIAMMAIGFARHEAAARPDNLLLPLDCAPGRDCWVVRYVDHGPGTEVQDYACGPMTGDGHKGTDFAVRDLAAVTKGVEVFAAA
ncbi:MAG: M23 family peptidase, partial [Sphingomonadales bacterium]|nr:M23 family peptidase [Sphingomonadales bacterium]